jgi:hypothetical protein
LLGLQPVFPICDQFEWVVIRWRIKWTVKRPWLELCSPICPNMVDYLYISSSPTEKVSTDHINHQIHSPGMEGI